MRGVTAARIASGSGVDDDDPRRRDRERPEQAEMLRRGGHDLGFGAEAEAAEDDVAGVGRARGERNLQRVGADERREPAPHLGAERHRLFEIRQARSVPPSKSRSVRGDERVVDGARHRPERPRVQVGDPVEHRELGPCLLEGHPSEPFHRCVVGQHDAILHAALRAARRWSGAARMPATRTWSIPSPPPS